MSLSRLPSLKSLLAFEAAARHLSFKQAATELSVTPGAISQQIRGLEETIGVSLFFRQARSVSLTETGQILSIQVSESFEGIQKTLNQFALASSPVLRINATAAMISKFLLPKINDFVDEFPNFAVNIETEFALNEMQFDGPDVFIRVTKAPPGNVFHQLLHKELLIPVASPLLIKRLGLNKPQDILKATLLHDGSISDFEGAPGWKNWFKEADLTCAVPEPAVDFQTKAPDMMVDMAIAGNGVFLGRSSLVQNALSSGMLSCPFGPVLQTDISVYALCRNDKRNEPNVRAFMGWLKQQAALLSTVNALYSAFSHPAQSEKNFSMDASSD